MVVTAGFVAQPGARSGTPPTAALLGTIPRLNVGRDRAQPGQQPWLLDSPTERGWSSSGTRATAPWSPATPTDTQSFFTAAAFSADGSEFVTAATVTASPRSGRSTGPSSRRSRHDADDQRSWPSAPTARLLATASEDGTATVTDLGPATTTRHVTPGSRCRGAPSPSAPRATWWPAGRDDGAREAVAPARRGAGRRAGRASGAGEPAWRSPPTGGTVLSAQRRLDRAGVDDVAIGQALPQSSSRARLGGRVPATPSPRDGRYAVVEADSDDGDAVPGAAPIDVAAGDVLSDEFALGDGGDSRAGAQSRTVASR